MERNNLQYVTYQLFILSQEWIYVLNAGSACANKADLLRHYSLSSGKSQTKIWGEEEGRILCLIQNLQRSFNFLLVIQLEYLQLFKEIGYDLGFSWR
jgi:hypothetical protein